MTAIPLLDVRDLTVEFQTRRGIVRAVQHVNVTVAKGETVGIVGESGSGKSVTSYAVMRILDRAGRIAEGSVMFTNIDVRQASEDDMRDAARPRNLDDLPEPARGAQSDPQGRPPDRGRAAGARQGGALGGHREGHRDPRSGPHRAAARALSRLSVRTVRRHVPARRHRAGAGLPPAAADRRRADHRPRRHHAEDGDGADRGADARARHVDDPDHARSRPCRHLLRQGRGDGEGPRRRDRDRARHLHRAGASLHPQADARDAAARRVAARSACPRRRRRPVPAATVTKLPGGRSQAAAGGRQAGQGISAQGPRRLRRRHEQAHAPRSRAGAGGVPRRRRHQLHRSTAAKASAWSASPAAASPPPRPWSCA